MNVIVDVRGMNVNMRVSEDPIEGISLAPKAFKLVRHRTIDSRIRSLNSRHRHGFAVANLGQRPRNPIARR